jgi:hypothetical protein
MTVFEAVGLVCGSTETCFSVRLIFGIVPVEPDHFAVALKGEYMRSDTIEEPPVVADDHSTAYR